MTDTETDNDLRIERTLHIAFANDSTLCNSGDFFFFFKELPNKPNKEDVKIYDSTRRTVADVVAGNVGLF